MEPNVLAICTDASVMWQRLDLNKVWYICERKSNTILVLQYCGQKKVVKCSDSAQVRPFEQTAQLLEDINSLKALHYDRKTGQFLDYGNHSEAMQLQPLVYKTPQGLVKGPLQRTLVDPSQPPRLQLVPQFG